VQHQVGLGVAFATLPGHRIKGTIGWRFL